MAATDYASEDPNPVRENTICIKDEMGLPAIKRAVHVSKLCTRPPEGLPCKHYVEPGPEDMLDCRP